MKIIIVVAIMISLRSIQAFGCANSYYALDKEGNFSYTDILTPFNKNFNKELNVQKLRKLEAKLKKEKNYMLLSDYAVCLMKLGKAKEALDLLAELNHHYPAEYKIAANLGTAYELNGELDSALKYINRGMQLNPNSHEGSEWVHVKILDAKLRQRLDPNWINKNSILGLTDAQRNDSAVFYHINIQLRERFPFTPGPNPFMAQLLTDLGDVSANITSIEYAKAYYQIAKEYYGGDPSILNLKIAEMQKLITKYAGKQLSTTGRTIFKNELANSLEHVDHNKLGYVNYKSLIDDNDRSRYQVNWGNINTDVNALLEMADLTMSASGIRDTIYNGAADTSGLRPVPDHDQEHIDSMAMTQMDTALSKDKKEPLIPDTAAFDPSGILVIFGAVTALGTLILLYFLRKKKK